MRKRERSPRRVQAAERAVRREGEAVALFPELSRYRTAAERLDAMDKQAAELDAGLRAFNASVWKRARKALRALPPDVRAAVLEKWQRRTWPGTANYLADVVTTAARDSARGAGNGS